MRHGIRGKNGILGNEESVSCLGETSVYASKPTLTARSIQIPALINRYRANRPHPNGQSVARVTNGSLYRSQYSNF